MLGVVVYTPASEFTCLRVSGFSAGIGSMQFRKYMLYEFCATMSDSHTSIR
jgi:hypothetical protein